MAWKSALLFWSFFRIRLLQHKKCSVRVKESNTCSPLLPPPSPSSSCGPKNTEAGKKKDQWKCEPREEKKREAERKREIEFIRTSLAAIFSHTLSIDLSKPVYFSISYFTRIVIVSSSLSIIPTLQTTPGPISTSRSSGGEVLSSAEFSLFLSTER